MKIFLWLVTIALGILCFGCWCFASLVIDYVRDFRAGYAIPAVAQLVLVPKTWLLVCPLPWVACAGFLSARRDISSGAALIFGGTAAVAMVLILFIVGLAAFLGAVPFKL
jgi:hypothetical protein